MKLKIIISTSKISSWKIQYICKMTVSEIPQFCMTTASTQKKNRFREQKWRHSSPRGHVRWTFLSACHIPDQATMTSFAETTDKVFEKQLLTQRKTRAVFPFFISFTGQKKVFFSWRNTPLYKSGREDEDGRIKCRSKRLSQEKLNISLTFPQGIYFCIMVSNLLEFLAPNRPGFKTLYSIDLRDLEQAT